ncbi:MAG TPA: SBBP repeat-containing protein [Bryobacteraceae bacterium]|jgi:hypothetical protein
MRHKISILLLAAVLGYGQKHSEAERSLPSFFIPNHGLTDPAIRYFVDTPDLRAGFRADSAVFQLHDLSLRVQFEGANPGVNVEGEEQLAARANFLVGDQPDQWHTGLPLYQKILYRSLYPGIDMTYGGTGHRIKSEFLVAPGADPSLIRLSYSGADTLMIDSHGDLIIRGKHMEVREEAPVVYQLNASGDRLLIAAQYRLLDAHTVGFDLGYYDPSLPLVIDPVISYATYVGGTGMSSVTALALDPSGNLYVAGWTEALDFHIVGAVQASNQGGVDMFIGKLNAAGTAYVYATYIGGKGDDRPAGIAVDGSGQAYVTGSTASSNFPVVSSLRPALGGGRDAFVLKLNSVGNTLLYSTLLGGSNTDWGYAIAIDSSGNAYIAGDTMSADFPIAGSGPQTVFGGQTDAFVAKLTSSGAYVFTTFLGGSGVEHAGGIAVDPSGNIYVAGGTTSANFPVVGAIQAVNGGSQDAFLTKLNSAGTQFVYSTYFGGNGGGMGTPEQANAVAVDPSGNAYIAGVTNSSNFPTTGGAFQGAFSGVQDAFVAKFNAAGNGLLYSTYWGGFSFDWASALAIDASGNAYIAGYTSTSGLPSVTPVQSSFNGMYDAFVAKLNPLGNGLSFSTYYGGTGSDSANAIAVDANGNIFVGGQTNSVDLTLQVPIQSSNISGAAGWVARFGVTPPPAQAPSALSVSPSSGSGNAVTFVALFSHPAGASAILSASILLNTTASSNFACQVTYTPATNLFALANDVASTGSLSVSPNSSGSVQNSQCTLNSAGTFATLSGTNFTLNVSLTFQAGFPGAKTVYLSASDANTSTGWMARGTWTVTIPSPPPTVVSATPSSGVGTFPTYTLLVSDPTSSANLSSVAMLVTNGTTTNIAGACYVVYNRTIATVSLYSDDGVSFTSKPLGSSANLQNSQCAVGYTAGAISGNSVQFTIQILYKSTFFGAKNLYVLASESGGASSGWVNVGTWTAANGIPTAVSSNPSSGAGVFPTYTMTVADPSSAANITSVAALITTGSATNTANACYVVYSRTNATVGLYGDDGVSFSSKPLGSSSNLQNSQCAVGYTTATTSGNNVIFTLQVLYKTPFFGPKNLYLLGSETGSVSSGFVNVGTWTVAYGIPTADSMSPSSGTGTFPTYLFAVSDPSSAANITSVGVLVTGGAPSNTAGSCYVIYSRTLATVGLYGDDGVSFSSKPLGSSSNLQNSQCAVGYAAGVVSGNSVQFTLQVLYKSGFSGPKTVYLAASETFASSGWVAKGTWTPQ